MPSQTLLISRYFVKSGQADALATKLGDNDASRIFISLDESEVLELRALEANQGKNSTALITVISQESTHKCLTGPGRIGQWSACNILMIYLLHQ